jgi:hypothetical protein
MAWTWRIAYDARQVKPTLQESGFENVVVETIFGSQGGPVVH